MFAIAMIIHRPGLAKRRRRFTFHGSGGLISFMNWLCGWLLDLEFQNVDNSCSKNGMRMPVDSLSMWPPSFSNKTRFLFFTTRRIDHRHVCFYVATIDDKFLASGFDIHFDILFMLETSTICALG